MSKRSAASPSWTGSAGDIGQSANKRNEESRLESDIGPVKNCRVPSAIAVRSAAVIIGPRKEITSGQLSSTRRQSPHISMDVLGPWQNSSSRTGENLQEQVPSTFILGIHDGTNVNGSTRKENLLKTPCPIQQRSLVPTSAERSRIRVSNFAMDVLQFVLVSEHCCNHDCKACATCDGGKISWYMFKCRVDWLMILTNC